MKILFHINNLNKLLKIIEFNNIKLYYVFDIAFMYVRNNIFDSSVMVDKLLNSYDLYSYLPENKINMLSEHLNELFKHIIDNIIVNELQYKDLIFSNIRGDNVILQSRTYNY